MIGKKLKATGVLLLTASGFQLYTGGNNIISLPFTPSWVRDLEIIKEDELDTQITAFIEKNKIIPHNMYIVLADSVLFQKEFAEQASASITPAATGPKEPSLPTSKPPAPLTPEQLLNEIQHYIETIPFENLSTKTYKIDKGIKVVGTNRTLYETIKKPFEEKGSIVEAIAPLSIIGREGIGKESLDKQLIKKIMQRTNLLKQNALEVHYQPSPATRENEGEPANKPLIGRKRLYLMLAVFGILILILIGVSINTFILSAPETKTTKAPSQILQSPPAIQSQTPAPVITTSTPSATINNEIRIQILNGSGITNQAKDLQSKLQKAGFQNIKIGESRNTNSEKTLVILNINVDSPTKDALIKELQKSFSEVTSQQTNDSSFDAIITTGKPLEETTIIKTP